MHRNYKSHQQQTSDHVEPNQQISIQSHVQSVWNTWRRKHAAMTGTVTSLPTGDSLVVDNAYLAIRQTTRSMYNR